MLWIKNILTIASSAVITNNSSFRKLSSVLSVVRNTNLRLDSDAPKAARQARIGTTTKGKAMSAEMKRCLFCGEEILAVAKKCKHRGSNLEGRTSSDAAISKPMWGCVVLLVALLAFSGCASLGITVGAPPGEKAVQVKSNIRVQRPAVSSLTVEVAKSSYTEMLNKGYARMGTIQCDTYIGTHGSAKQYLLRESQKNGAEVAWIVLYDKKKTVTVGKAGSGTVWSGGEYGKGSLYNIDYREKYLDYKYISGVATLFVRDPALAARQLKEGKALWEAVAADRKEEQQILIGKLSQMEDTIRGYADSLFGEFKDEKKQAVLDWLAEQKIGVVNGRTYESFVEQLRLPYSWRYGKHIKQAKQAVQLLMDVEQYANDHMTLFDYYEMLKSTDKILLY